jgi:Putative peptidoglycan binding domain
LKRLTRSKTLFFAAACALLLTCVEVTAQSGEQASSASKSATVIHQKKRGSATSSASKRSAHTSTAKGKSSGSRRRKRTARGQQKIDSERAQSIQQALVREHYLSGEPTGTWNQASEDAMRRYQADHGWQTKTVPDARALIQLGLGPSKDHLLNPESAMTTVPDAPKAASLTPVSHGPDPSAPASKTPTSEPVPPSSQQTSSGPQ